MPTLLGLIGSVWLSRGSTELKFWLMCAACIVVVAVLTFAFFVPTNTAFASGTLEEAEAAAKLSRWLTIHNLRIGFGMAAAIFGCIAIRA